jgi:uncharacterized protein (DUF2236 family)
MSAAANARVMPAPELWGALAPRPGTIAWQRAGDVRLLLAAGYALLLQVSHPVVGAGVSEHSQFRRDPWGRLLRTLDYSYTMVYGGPRAAGEMGARIRAMHRPIRGTLPDGRAYHALEPRAYAWVHATLADAIVLAHARFGDPLDSHERERFWAEWRTMGQLLGIRERDLPVDWAAFRDYFAATVERDLRRTAAVDEVLAALARPAPPAAHALWRAAFGVARFPLAHVLPLASVGLLAPQLRRRFGAPFSTVQALQLRALGAALRSVGPLLPPPLKIVGPRYLRVRAGAPGGLGPPRHGFTPRTRAAPEDPPGSS